MSLEVTCTGLAKGTPPDPCVPVIFGASGDLAPRALIPSLYALNCRGLLSEPFAIIGFGILPTFLAKQPGPDICVWPVTMNFRNDTTFGIEKPPNAYEWLLLDAMHGDQTLFPCSDWIYNAWSVVDPIIQQWEATPPQDLPNYAAGSWGPAAADVLLRQDGRAWYAL
jgi:glucose-6-phosphate 1-dehydrogenase